MSDDLDSLTQDMSLWFHQQAEFPTTTVWKRYMIRSKVWVDKLKDFGQAGGWYGWNGDTGMYESREAAEEEARKAYGESWPVYVEILQVVIGVVVGPLDE